MPAPGNDAAVTHDFRLLAGDHALDVDDTVIKSQATMHFFCGRCGAPLVSRERTPAGMRYAVNVTALENVAASNGGKEVLRTC